MYGRSGSPKYWRYLIEAMKRRWKSKAKGRGHQTSDNLLVTSPAEGTLVEVLIFCSLKLSTTWTNVENGCACPFLMNAVELWFSITSDGLSFGNIRWWNNCITYVTFTSWTQLIRTMAPEEVGQVMINIFRCILNTQSLSQAIPASQRGSWSSFLKAYDVLPCSEPWSQTSHCSRIASFSGDLSSLTAPPFILSPTSLTEFPGQDLPQITLLSSVLIQFRSLLVRAARSLCCYCRCKTWLWERYCCASLVHRPSFFLFVFLHYPHESS